MVGQARSAPMQSSWGVEGFARRGSTTILPYRPLNASHGLQWGQLLFKAAVLRPREPRLGVSAVCKWPPVFGAAEGQAQSLDYIGAADLRLDARLNCGGAQDSVVAP